MGDEYNRIWRDTSAKVLAPILTRIAIDVSSIPIRHVNVDQRDNFLGVRDSELNDRLRIQANIDQSGVAFIRDAVMTLLESGKCALVPIQHRIKKRHQIYLKFLILGLV